MQNIFRNMCFINTIHVHFTQFEGLWQFYIYTENDDTEAEAPRSK